MCPWMGPNGHRLSIRNQNDTIVPEMFTLDVFFNFYKLLILRNEVDRIFDQL